MICSGASSKMQLSSRDGNSPRNSSGSGLLLADELEADICCTGEDDLFEGGVSSAMASCGEILRLELSSDRDGRCDI